MKLPASRMGKGMIAAAALGLLLALAGAILLMVAARRVQPHNPGTPQIPDAYEDFGPVAHAFARPKPAPNPRRLPADALKEAVAAELDHGRWQGKLPAGTVHVAAVDEVNAGAENGHTVPVTLWIVGREQVAGLTGDAAFAVSEGDVQVRQLNLAPVPLKVATWSEAVRRVQAARPDLPMAQRDEAPFYGQFHLLVRQERFAVDAVTGKVEQE